MRADDSLPGHSPPRPTQPKSSLPVVIGAGAALAILVLGAFFGVQKFRAGRDQQAAAASASAQEQRNVEVKTDVLKSKVEERRADFDRMVGAVVRVPGGPFNMGANEDILNEQPIHKVTVPPFEMDETEVTVAAFQLCVGAGKCSPPAAGPQCNWAIAERRGHPVNCVTWNQAQDFCAWAAKRLPSEQEWEFAARGTDGRRFSWGTVEPFSQLCWRRGGADGGSGEGTCLAGQTPEDASPYFVKDMAGNVREWTASSYCPYSRTGCESSTKVIRGGAWPDVDVLGVRAALRNAKAPEYQSDTVGFRCVRGALR